MSDARPYGRLATYIALLDPAPVAMVLIGATGFTAAAVQGRPPLERLAPFLVALLFTQFAIALHNHYCDRELDARTKPWRALPRGLVAPRVALASALVLLTLGLLAALSLGPWVLTLVAAGTGAGFLYNAWLKHTVWSWVPFWFALPTLPVCSFVLVDRFPPQLWSIYVLGGPLIVAVHLADVLTDLDLDRAGGVRGLAHRLGSRWSRYACWAALALTLVLALLLWPAGRAPGPLYFAAWGLLGVAMLLGRGRVRRGHWLAIMASALALVLGWVADLAAG